MKSADYWQKRFTAVENMNHNTAKKAVQSVTPAFDKAQRQIDSEINAWYQRYADNNQISLQEAKIQLNAKEMKELKWDIDDYINYGRQNAIDGKWTKELENASAKYHISRLEALKIRTQNAAEVAFGNEQDILDQLAARIYTDDYYHTAFEIQKGLGIGWDIGQIDQTKLDKLLKKPWTTDKMTFSDRIWKSKTQLVDSLSTELTQMCILGKAPDEAIKNISHAMNVSKNQAGRLIMTESAYFSSAAQKDCFNSLDVEQFEIVATLDSHTSEICQQMDGQHFDMKDFQEGVTAPPFHVWCRSTTVPYFDDEFTVGETRAARGEDGNTYQVPANMKYQDWKENFVDKTKDPADWMKPAEPEQVTEAEKELVELRKKIIDGHDKILTTDTQKAEFAEIINGMDKDEANLYNKMCTHASKNHYYDKRTGWYSPSKKMVEMDLDNIQWDGVVGRTSHAGWKVKFHEESHQLDHILASKKSPFALIDGTVDQFDTWKFTRTRTVTGKKLISAIDDDVLNMINKAIDWESQKYGTVQKHIKSLNRIPKEAKDSLILYLKETYPDRKSKAMIDTVTDAIGMTTKGNIHPYSNGFWGHKAAYCKDYGKDGAVSEMWANMNAFFLRNDTEAIAAVETEMPSSVQAFRDVHMDVVEYAKANDLTY